MCPSHPPVARNLPSGEKERLEGLVGSIGWLCNNANSLFGFKESNNRIPRSFAAKAIYRLSSENSIPVHAIVGGKGGGVLMGVPSGPFKAVGWTVY
jgi:hypothetical protein